MKKTMLGLLTLVVSVGTMEAKVIEKDGVIVYTAEASANTRQANSINFSHAKAMEKTLPTGSFDPERLKDALTPMRYVKEKSMNRASSGDTGKGGDEAFISIPLTKVDKMPKRSPQEYGDEIDGYVLPYTTSRVDMYQGINKTAFSKKYPYRATGQLFFEDDDGNTYICSASMIKRGVLVTAAHCVSEYGEEEMYKNFQYVPARRKKSAPYNVWEATNVYVKAAYYKGAEAECGEYGVVCRDDVAVIVLKPQSGKFAGDYTGWYSYGINTYSYAENSIAQITQLGYPYSHDEATMMQRNDSLGVRLSVAEDGKGHKIYQTVIGSRMTGGSSGGPWIVNFGQIAKLGDGTKRGHEGKFNVVVGVTSWGFTSDSYKLQGASLFNKNNIRVLVNTACENNSDACSK